MCTHFKKLTCKKKKKLACMIFSRGDLHLDTDPEIPPLGMCPLKGHRETLTSATSPSFVHSL